MFKSIIDDFRSKYFPDEIDIIYTYPRFIDKTPILNLYKYDITYYDESLYKTKKGVIALKDYNNSYSTTQIRQDIKSEIDNISDVNIVARKYINTTISNNLTPFITRSYACHTYNTNDVNLIIVIDVNNATKFDVKINIELHNINSMTYDSIRSIMTNISNVLFNSCDIIGYKTYKTLKGLQAYYCDNIPLPLHVHKRNIHNISSNVLITKKLDGERRFLCITSYGCYAFNRSMTIYAIDYITRNILDQSIFDCEFYNGCYYIIDVILLSSKEMINCNFDIRLKSIKTYISNHKDNIPTNICVKEYIECKGDNLLNMIRDVVCDSKYDGIVVIEPKLNYYSNQYKFKKYNTCDLIYRKSSDNSKAMVETSDNKLYDSILYNNIDDGLLCECLYDTDNNIWNPTRIRTDKKRATKSKHINSTLRSVTIFDIITYDSRSIIVRCNIIKNNIIKHHKQGSVLLDIGTGNGNDIYKWKKKYRWIYCIEKNKTYIKDIINSFNKYNIETYTIISNKLSDATNINDLILYKINIVTIFFTIMLFDDNDMIVLSDLLQNSTTDKCTVDVIFPHDSLILKVKEWCKRTDDDKVCVTIPNTNIINNIEYLLSSNYVKCYFESIGYKLINSYYLDPSFSMQDSCVKFIRSLLYMRFIKEQ